MSALDELPARVTNLESQILQFRDEVRVEFSAVRSEIGRVLSQMRMLHEDVIDRIKLTGEK